MPDLRQQLRQCLEGRVCFVGLGNVARGDDGFGIRLAERLAGLLEKANAPSGLDAASFPPPPKPAASLRKQPQVAILNAGTTPERWLPYLAEQGFDQVIFLDAVEFGGAPGSVVLLNAEEIAARFPLVSTHKLSLGLLAKLVETGGPTRVWLLGVQPVALKPDQELTPTVQRTLELLLELVIEVLEETPLPEPFNGPPGFGVRQSAGALVGPGNVRKRQRTGAVQNAVAKTPVPGFMGPIRARSLGLDVLPKPCCPEGGVPEPPSTQFMEAEA